MKRTFTLAAIAAAAAASLSPALAQETPADRTHVVSFADLDLSRKADVRRLDRRIALAVEDVCGSASSADPAGRNDVRRCRVETTARLTSERERAISSRGRPDILVAARER